MIHELRGFRSFLYEIYKFLSVAFIMWRVADSFQTSISFRVLLSHVKIPSKCRYKFNHKGRGNRMSLASLLCVGKQRKNIFMNSFPFFFDWIMIECSSNLCSKTLYGMIIAVVIVLVIPYTFISSREWWIPLCAHGIEKYLLSMFFEATGYLNSHVKKSQFCHFKWRVYYLPLDWNSLWFWIYNFLSSLTTISINFLLLNAAFSSLSFDYFSLV